MTFALNEYHKNISKDELLEDLCIVAKKLNKSYLSRSEYEKNGKYSATPYINNFGSWLVACKEAGLRTTRNKEDFVHISDEDLLEDMVQVSKLLKKKSISTKDYSDYGLFVNISDDGSFARIEQVNDDSSFIEWNLTTLRNDL